VRLRGRRRQINSLEAPKHPLCGRLRRNTATSSRWRGNLICAARSLLRTAKAPAISLGKHFVCAEAWNGSRSCLSLPVMEYESSAVVTGSNRARPTRTKTSLPGRNLDTKARRGRIGSLPSGIAIIGGIAVSRDARGPLPSVPGFLWSGAPLWPCPQVKA